MIIRREKNSLLLTGWENKEQEQFKENSKYAEGPAKKPCLGNTQPTAWFLYQHVKEHRSFSRKSDAKVTKKKVTPLLYLCR